MSFNWALNYNYFAKKWTAFSIRKNSWIYFFASFVYFQIFKTKYKVRISRTFSVFFSIISCKSTSSAPASNRNCFFANFYAGFILLLHESVLVELNQVGFKRNSYCYKFFNFMTANQFTL